METRSPARQTAQPKFSCQKFRNDMRSEQPMQIRVNSYRAIRVRSLAIVQSSLQGAAVFSPPLQRCGDRPLPSRATHEKNVRRLSFRIELDVILAAAPGITRAAQ